MYCSGSKVSLSCSVRVWSYRVDPDIHTMLGLASIYILDVDILL